jgi:hypothetical protein
MKVSQYDFVGNPDLYLEVISTRVKEFILLFHKPIAGMLVERLW